MNREAGIGLMHPVMRDESATWSVAPGGRRKLTRLEYGLLFLLTVVGFGLRIVGAQSSIAYIPDTQVVRQGMQIGQNLLTGSGSVETKYPFTLPIYLSAVYSVASVGLLVTGHATSVQTLTDFVFGQRESIHLLSVVALGLINTALIPVMLYASRRLNWTHRGWLAAGFATFDLLLIQFSHHARPHVPLATFVMLVIVAAIEVAYGGGWRWALALSLSCALAVGTLQSGIAVALPLAVAWLARPYRKGQYHWRELVSVLTLVSLGLFVVLSVALHPALLTEYPQLVLSIVSGEGRYVLGGGAHNFSSAMFSLQNLPRLITFLFSYQPILTLLASIAFVYFLYTRRRHLRLMFVIIPFLLLQLGMWGMYAGLYPRILAALVPLLILLVAYLLEDVALWIKSRAWLGHRYAYPAILMIFLIPTLIIALRFATVTAQPDTRTLASQWIEHKTEPGATVLTSFYAQELTPTATSLRQQQEAFPGSLGTEAEWLLMKDAANYPQPAYDVVDRKSTRLNSSHLRRGRQSRMPSSA